MQQILDFSRRSPITTYPLDLKPFVEQAIHILKRTIPENIHLFLDAEPQKYIVDADPTRIQQALINLALNARDAMPDGGELGIRLEQIVIKPGEPYPMPEMEDETQNQAWICLSVAHTSVGIPSEAVSHIFEPFFTTKGPREGAGLGLAQVYGIVKQHKGHIDVETTLGKGTIFRTYLPAHRAEELDEIARDKALPSPRGKGETILLVEDEEKIREAGKRVLESLGYQVETAADGREALEVYWAAERACLERGQDAHSRGIDLVITDLVMPEMGGKELIRELRKANPDLKALVITGYVMRQDLKELVEKDFLDVIHKPFDIDGLAKVVRRALTPGK